MREFILGFVSAIVFLIAVLPFLSKWAMKIFLKRKMDSVVSMIGGDLKDLGDKFVKIQDDGKEKNKTSTEGNEGRDISGKRTSDGPTKTGS